MGRPRSEWPPRNCYRCGRWAPLVVAWRPGASLADREYVCGECMDRQVARAALPRLAALVGREGA
jgi:hypothetical protein